MVAIYHPQMAGFLLFKQHEFNIGTRTRSSQLRVYRYFAQAVCLLAHRAPARPSSQRCSVTVITMELAMGPCDGHDDHGTPSKYIDIECHRVKQQKRYKVILGHVKKDAGF